MSNLENLRKEATKVWVEYGEAIVKAFKFAPGSKIVAEPLLNAIRTTDEQRLREFIAWVRKETDRVAKAKFFGEK